MIEEYIRGVAMRKNPALLKQRLAQHQAQQMADQFQNVIGQRGQEQQTAPFEADMFPGEQSIQGLETITQEAVAPTGMYDESIPLQHRYFDMFKRAGETGIPGFNEYVMNNLSAMQKQQMDNLGALERRPSAGQLSASGKIATDLGYTPGTPAYNDFVRSHSMRPGTTVNVGGQGPIGPIFATPEQKRQMGYDEDAVVMIDQKTGKPYMAPAISELGAKNINFFEMMETSDQAFDDIMVEYPDFDPTSNFDAMMREYQASGSPFHSIASKFQSPASKQYHAATMNWIAANRGALSGAAVPEIEVQRDLQTYFPTAGDTPAVMALKKQLRANRKNAIARTLNLSTEKRQKLLKESADSDSEKIKAMKAEQSTANPSTSKIPPEWQAEYEEFKKNYGK